MRFGKTENEAELVTPSTPVAPIANTEEEREEDEPEVEVELIFEDESDEEEPSVEEPAVEEPVEESVEESVVKEEPAVEKEEKISTPTSTLSTPKRSPLLSLYEDTPTPVVGEQFHEKPSVADTIACPKGVAESTPVVSLREAIGVADKFMLIRELFGGDAVAYESAITALDSQSSFDDCLIYIAEHYVWSPNGEGTKMMMELLQRKYNA